MGHFVSLCESEFSIGNKVAGENGLLRLQKRVPSMSKNLCGRIYVMMPEAGGSIWSAGTKLTDYYIFNPYTL
jgi:hypothetical protein